MRFIIYSPPYDEKIGGSIVLHRLCDLLNKEGVETCLSQFRPHFDIKNPILSSFKVLGFFLFSVMGKRFKTFPEFNTPIASYLEKKDAIVIYPETVFGNPLNAKKVIRWLLHRPGFHTGLVHYDEKDLIFFFQKAFNSHDLKLRVGGELQVLHIRKDVYKKTNYGKRFGTCYILRKGKGRTLVHDLSDSIIIDDLSHEDIAEIFNRTEKFISYDSYTLYSQYAAMCGCISIVIPEYGVARDTWQPVEGLRFGVSYGFDEIEWAQNTQEKVTDYLSNQEALANRSVKQFISFCEDHFT